MSEGTQVEVIHLTPEWEKEWERFAETSHDVTVAHSLEWRRVVEHTYRHTPLHLMAVERERVTGLLPLFLIDSGIFGRFIVSAPYLSYGGLAAENEEAARALIDRAKQLAVAQRVKYLETRGLNKVDHGLLPKETYCTYLLPLEPDPEAVWGRLEKRARNAVRKAAGYGLTVERGPHLVSAFARVSNHLLRDLGTPSHAGSLYRNILAEWGDRAEILMIRHQNSFIGGGLTVTWRGSLAWLYGGCLKGYRDMAAMNLLTWEIIRYACEQGVGTLDFGRSQWDSGTALFKRQWGAQPSPLFYEYHLADGETMPDMDPTNPRFRLAIAIWKRLPIFLAKRLGPAIIRGIP